MVRGFFDDIMRQMTCIKQECGTLITLQCVRSHEDAFGNEWVDHLAKEGMMLVVNDTEWHHDG